jgi:NTE family protein
MNPAAAINPLPATLEPAMPHPALTDCPPAPCLALVLGSGGVRSIAALGMVEVLAREGLMPDLLVGCSAGAMFGALIAAGHSADEAVRIATTLWSADVTRKRRLKAIPQMLWPRLGGFDADFSLRDDEPVMQRLRQAFGTLRIEDLRIPLRVTATDAVTGERVVLRQGPLVQALRASIALPFMFSPVHISGRRLIDGFIADPLPVSAAGDAKAVLALGFESPMPRRIDGPSRLLAQVTSALTNNLMQARLAESGTAGARLLSLVPQLTRRVGLFDTEAMPYLVDAGRRATEARLPEIRALLQGWPEGWPQARVTGAHQPLRGATGARQPVVGLAAD